MTHALGTADFLPTILGMMGVATAGKEDGRDTSAWFTGTPPPAGLKDITFVRGTGAAEANWLAAITSRYKLIVSPTDAPWLIDMQADPDELRNFCTNPEYRPVVQGLARELLAYGTQFNDPRARVTKIRDDLEHLAEAL